MNCNLDDVFGTSVPRGKNPSEWRARQELACAYRLFDHYGWHELIYNHISVRVPGSQDHFLINPFGLLYGEVTASNLVKIDLEGQIVEKSDYQVNPAGFIVHSAIHAARHDLNAVAHTHTTAAVAVSAQKDGLLPLTITSMFYTDQVAYHDFEGITLDREERERMQANLGDKHLLILRNHGIVAAGRTLAHAFLDLYHLQRACEMQIAAQAAGMDNLNVPCADVARRTAKQHKAAAYDNSLEPEMVFAAMARLMVKKDPSFLA